MFTFKYNAFWFSTQKIYRPPTGLSDPESLIVEIVANHKNVIRKKEGESRSDDVMLFYKLSSVNYFVLDSKISDILKKYHQHQIATNSC